MKERQETVVVITPGENVANWREKITISKGWRIVSEEISFNKITQRHYVTVTTEKQ